MWANCSHTKLGRVQGISVARMSDGSWDATLFVDCGPGFPYMEISRTSQTHMFSLPETKAVVAKVLAAIEEIESVEQPDRDGARI